jgi:hypothetical protein
MVQINPGEAAQQTACGISESGFDIVDRSLSGIEEIEKI